MNHNLDTVESAIQRRTIAHIGHDKFNIWREIWGRAKRVYLRIKIIKHANVLVLC